MNRVITGAIATVIAVAVCISGCGIRDYAMVERRGAAWNTTYCVKYRGAESLGDSIEAVLKEIEMSLSPFNPNSVISAINDNRSMAVDSNIEAVFEVAKRVNSLSGGTFDPTLSPLINLWGFGYKNNDSERYEPSDSAINEALEAVGLADCHIENGEMVKKVPGTTFNFSAVTKGYGCDRVGEMLRRNGVVDYMVEIGGELALSGVNDRGEVWHIMIDAPVEDMSGHTRLTTLDLTDCGVATSGNYRNYRVTEEGRHVGHTIDRATGRPVETATLSATVIAPDCATADALATACMAMEPLRAIAMIDSLPGVSCIMVMADDEGGYRVLVR